MKKLLSLILAFVMAACMFSACTETDRKNSGETDDVPEAEVVIDENRAVGDVVTSCMKAILNGDAAGLDYVKKDSEAYEALNALLVEYNVNIEAFSRLGQEIGISESYHDEVTRIASEGIKEIFSKSTIDIDSVEVNGNKATAHYTLGVPDVRSASSSLDEEFVEGILNEAFAEEAPADEIGAQDGDMSKYWIKAFDKIITAITAASADKITEKEGSFELEKLEGSWIITDNK